jgi:hypothetical protein
MINSREQNDNWNKSGNFIFNSRERNDNWNKSARSGNKSAKPSRDSGKKNGANENAWRRSVFRKKQSERNESSGGWRD